MISFKNKWLLLVVAASLSLGVAAATEKKEEKKEEQSKGYLEAQKKSMFSKENIAKRTAPVGKIYVEGDDVPAAAPPPVVESTGPRSGGDVYTANCSACHGAGVGGAPKFGTSAWSDLAAANSIDALLQSVVNGKGIMPPRGGCANCSDDELKDAIQHMIDSAQ
ncbi:c-type cytochrome [Pleionea litopenaei]|uniref:C-type cytochrome n=1 Tax=Pleionea litopenaei TaxID=3070815 RepID=A0AA51RSC2_9GAMM|nr:c-type cytochrome [Pleionea sp. HL-JVS1]WMS86599.1 c-type cytochrome [Pleionea sp. HL-JVS1]